MLLYQYTAHEMHEYLRHVKRNKKILIKVDKEKISSAEAYTEINCKMGYYDHYNDGYEYMGMADALLK